MCQDCLAKFQEAVIYVTENGIDEHYNLLTEMIIEQEQNCDETRRLIEHSMYAQSLLPETREDILVIVELMDQIPNHCQSVSCMMMDQKSSVMDEIKKDLVELINLSVDTFSLTVEAVKDCLGRMDKVSELIKKVDDNEKIGDNIERKMVRAIFASDDLSTHPGGQLIQKEIITKTGEILDLCKHLTEKIIITAIKRHV